MELCLEIGRVPFRAWWRDFPGTGERQEGAPLQSHRWHSVSAAKLATCRANGRSTSRTGCLRRPHANRPAGVQAGMQPVYPAKPTCQSAWRSAMQAGRWSILQVVRLDVLHPVFHADRQTCKQANRHRCRNANCRAYPCGLECVRRAQCSVAPANSSTKMETWADVMQPQV